MRRISSGIAYNAVLFTFIESMLIEMGEKCIDETTGKKTGKQPVSEKVTERARQEKLVSCLSPSA